jgi:cytochrome o ubiquinol oxidase subunit 2
MSEGVDIMLARFRIFVRDPEASHYSGRAAIGQNVQFTPQHYRRRFCFHSNVPLRFPRQAMPTSKKLRILLLLPLLAVLGGCNMVLLSPSGDVALQQRNLIIISTVLMLIIIIPVIFLTLLFAWRYRASNTEAAYNPEWHHSTVLELLIWAAPLLIIIALGAVTWVSTHKLDPYRPLDRIASGQDIPAGSKPLVVEVVALDWKWLFLYPEQGIATVNELAAPVDRPIQFKITASTVMNSFFIPALAGQIYAMPGMETTLHAVINHPGVYEGFSANYSGAGFSGMRFKFRGMSDGDFEQWVKEAKTEAKPQANAKNNGIKENSAVTPSSTLTRAAYLQLEQPSENNPVLHYASVAPGLYDAILNRCVQAGSICMKDMMAAGANRAVVPSDAMAMAMAMAMPTCTAANSKGATGIVGSAAAGAGREGLPL